MKDLVEPRQTASSADPHRRVSALLDRSTLFLVWPVAIILFCLPVVIQERIDHSVRSVDFVYFYAISKILHNQPAENIYKPQILAAVCNEILPVRDPASAYGPSPYPPFVALVLEPLARLPFWMAFRIHQVISVALYSAGTFLLLRTYFPAQSIWSNAFLPFSIAYLPWVANTLMNGQLSAIGFFAIALALVQRELKHPFRSGVALSLCLYKPTLLLLLIPMLLVRKQFRVLAGISAGGALLITVAVAAFGWHTWVSYGRLVLSLGSLEKLRQLPQFVDLTAFFSLLVGSRLGTPIALVCTAAALVGLIAAWRRKGDDGLAWASAISATAIVGPYVPLYDTILITPSLVASAAYLRLRGRNALPALLVLVFVCGWVSAALALSVHVQLLTVAIAVVGLFQTRSLFAGTGDNRATDGMPLR